MNTKTRTFRSNFFYNLIDISILICISPIAKYFLISDHLISENFYVCLLLPVLRYFFQPQEIQRLPPVITLSGCIKITLLGWAEK